MCEIPMDGLGESRISREKNEMMEFGILAGQYSSEAERL